MIQIRMAISVTSTILLIQIWFRFDYDYFSIWYYSINKDEALAVAKALQFVADIGINQVVLEGDSQVLMRALMTLNPYGLSIEDVKLYFRIFNQLHYSHTKRESTHLTQYDPNASKTTWIPYWPQKLPKYL